MKADVGLEPMTTPYERLGEWVAWLCAIGCVAAIVVARKRRHVDA